MGTIYLTARTAAPFPCPQPRGTIVALAVRKLNEWGELWVGGADGGGRGNGGTA